MKRWSGCVQHNQIIAHPFMIGASAVERAAAILWLDQCGRVEVSLNDVVKVQDCSCSLITERRVCVEKWNHCSFNNSDTKQKNLKGFPSELYLLYMSVPVIYQCKHCLIRWFFLQLICFFHLVFSSISESESHPTRGHF